MNYKMTFDYTDNNQIKDNYKTLLKSKGFTMKKASELIVLSTPQQLNNKFNNKRLSLEDLAAALDAVGCTLEISFKEKAEN